MRVPTLNRSAIAVILMAALTGCRTPYQTTGIKICEVTQNSAIVWTRLCVADTRVDDTGALPEIVHPKKSDDTTVPAKRPYAVFPEGLDVGTIDGAVPGSPGEVRVRYRPVGSDEWSDTGWTAVDPNADFTRQVQLEALKAGSEYELQVLGRKNRLQGRGETINGQFRTAPAATEPAPVSFMVVTGQRYPRTDLPGRGFKAYPAMLALDPDFFVHTGDILYYDQFAKSVPLAHWHWQRTYSLPTNVEFHRNVASYFMKDDHDTICNDCWPSKDVSRMGEFTFEDGVRIFKEQVGMGEKTYRTIRWGKDLQIWLVEGRDYRSPNTMPDGPEKTIWDAEQMDWFKRTVTESDATFRVLISPTPIVGPDRDAKSDNHANAVFAHEGQQLRAFLVSQKNMVVVCGDRHWQYVSQDPQTQLLEYSCGPMTDKHAGGWDPEDKRPMHLYLNVCGGFLQGAVERRDGKPTLIMRHYDVDGKLLNEDVRTAE
jgi:alkaline phosphatase D